MDKRKHSRVATQLPISFFGEDIAGEGRLANISKEGCMVVSHEQVEPEALLGLRIQIPENESLMEVDLAVVRWAHGGKFGLEFVQMHPDERERLHRIVSALEPVSLRR